MSKIKFIAGSALVLTAAGVVEAIGTPRLCDIHEVCMPLPINQGDEPSRDGPKGPAGPTGLTVGSTVTGPTGARVA